jgi:hypothetical protein
MKTSALMAAVLLGVGALGCSGTEGDCETFCDWAEECSPEETSSDCVDECVEDVDDADDACQEAFEALAECLEEDDSCTADSSCASEAGKSIEDCADDID